MHEQLHLPLAPTKSITFSSPEMSQDDTVSTSFPNLETEYHKRSVKCVIKPEGMGEFQVQHSRVHIISFVAS